MGDATPISWVHRDERYGEKLATPDTSIADLIGEVDPIKIAEGRHLSNEETIHFGLVPRTNRGIFAINELPDLAERIQVGLLNVLEERDVQIRGFKLRLPLDVMLFASANPDDYTNRGRLITPLKDRFGSQIRTHYPLDVATEVTIALQEARNLEVPGIEVRVPAYMTEIVAEFSQLARRSPHINQRSGVSVRLTVANLETLEANAMRRALQHGETIVVPRVSDLDALAASTIGKVEIETIEEGREGLVVEQLLKAAVLGIFREYIAIENLRDVVDSFDGAWSTPVKTCLRPTTSHCLATSQRLRRTSPLLPVATPHRRLLRVQLSSCSKVCTFRSASTKMPLVHALSTAAAENLRLTSAGR